MSGGCMPPEHIIFLGGIMNNLNSILIEGNLVRDPMFRSTPQGTPLCTFSLASNSFFKKDSGLEKEVSFFDVETWAKLAENCYNLGHKGRGVRVVGRLKQERWLNAEGKSRSRVTIVAEHVEFRPDFKRNQDDDGASNGTTGTGTILNRESELAVAAIEEASNHRSGDRMSAPGDTEADTEEYPEEAEMVTF
jgi:single-strand DNA-binding protein